ncbi:MAG: DUF5335 family protein [Desulfobulbaceae bacterium]
MVEQNSKLSHIELELSTRKQIENEHWQKKLQTLTSTNRGRSAVISIHGMTIVENKPFDHVIYDPIRKGNDLVLALEGFIHMVNEPVEIYMTHDSNGVVSTLEILGQNGEPTILRLL